MMLENDAKGKVANEQRQGRVSRPRTFFMVCFTVPVAWTVTVSRFSTVEAVAAPSYVVSLAVLNPGICVYAPAWLV
jgi:hypothetical protein